MKCPYANLDNCVIWFYAESMFNMVLLLKDVNRIFAVSILDTEYQYLFYVRITWGQRLANLKYIIVLYMNSTAPDEGTNEYFQISLLN